MKKEDCTVGIVTKMSKNYGAVLQAYALKKTIEKFGFNTRIINYNGAIGNLSYNLFKREFSLNSIKVNFLRLFHYNEIKCSIERFQKFRKKYFDLTESYASIKDFRNAPPEFDVYIVGSDQVWNPQILFSPIYYLDFGGSEKKRIAYAASFGNNNIPVDYKNEIQRLLYNFNAISVREGSGVDILKELGHVGVEVLDPTLLLEQNEWKSIMQAPDDIKEPYIVCYFLHNHPKIETIVENVKKMTGYKVINIATDVGLYAVGDEQRWDIGPKEFVWLFANADYVITSSFHGTVFSIIFERKFWTVNLNPNDSRLRNILKTFNLEANLIEINQEILVEPSMQIDYEKTKEILKKERERSKQFILSSIIK